MYVIRSGKHIIGVPQGSIMWPLFFRSFFIDEYVSILHKKKLNNFEIDTETFYSSVVSDVRYTL